MRTPKEAKARPSYRMTTNQRRREAVNNRMTQCAMYTAAHAAAEGYTCDACPLQHKCSVSRLHRKG